VSAAAWRQLREYFDEALTLPPEQREAFIRGITANDADLGARLEAMLAGTEDGEGVSLTGVVAGAAVGLDQEERDRRIGQRLGPYRITAHVARGGMGDVFEAERADGEFEQRVAIKLIGSAALSADAVSRFRAERQILARLNHPNIAQILDGGTTGDGTTYLVMEYVEGLPVDEHARQHRLGLRDRLALFRRICDVLEFAHRNLVVHRDIKPTNILITADGEPKLLDFGIAKLLESDAPTEQVAPATTRIMTPDYASPEQILGQPITTSCDVYSLGVLLYELLSGRRPHQLRGKRPSELEHAVCETTPSRPSEIVDAARAGYPSRRTPGRWLAGDLDNIVMMALRVRPEHRYQSVQQLSADIRRYLDGQPVAAQGRSWTYLTTKFLRRNRMAVAAAAVALVVLAGLVGYHIRQISEERDLVRQEAERTAAVSEFLKDIFHVSNPDQSLGETITARDILDQGAARLDTELAGQPGIRATLMATIGEVYGFLGLYDSAIDELEQAVALQRGVNDPAALASSLELLARNLYEAGDMDRALALLDEAQDRVRQAGMEDSALNAQVLYTLGQLHMFRGDYDQSLYYHEAAHERWVALPSDERRHAANALDGLGQTLHLQGDLDGAEEYLRAALATRRAADGKTTATVLANIHNLATLLHEKAEYAEAEELYLEVYEGEIRITGLDHPDRDTAMTNLGRLYRETGRFEEAEHYLREAVAHSTRTRGAIHRYTAYNQNNLAGLLSERGQHAEARTTFETVLEVYAQTVPPDHPFIASSKVAYGALLIELDEPAAAEGHARDALAICEAALPQDHWLTARSRGVLGGSLLAQGHADQAEPLLLAAYENLRVTRPGNRMTRAVLVDLVALYQGRGDQDAADGYERLLRELDAAAAG
jgi:serine/threonine-protein kinase